MLVFPVFVQAGFIFGGGSGSDIVDGVPAPDPVLAWVADYVEKHMVGAHLERSIRYALRNWQSARALFDREEQLRQAGILAADDGMYSGNNLAVVHHLNAGLRAHALYQRDVDYIVRDDKVVIIDEFTGRMEAVNAVEIRPRVSGYIRRIGFNEGNGVRKGQLLFEIDPLDHNANIASAVSHVDTPTASTIGTKIPETRSASSGGICSTKARARPSTSACRPASTAGVRRTEGQ